MRIGRTFKRNVAADVVRKAYGDRPEASSPELGLLAYRCIVSEKDEAAARKAPKAFFKWSKSIVVSGEDVGGKFKLPLPEPKPFPANEAAISVDDEGMSKVVAEVARLIAAQREYDLLVDEVYASINKYSTLASLLGHEPALYQYVACYFTFDELEEAGIGTSLASEIAEGRVRKEPT